MTCHVRKGASPCPCPCEYIFVQEGLLDEAALLLVLAAANTAPIAQQKLLPHVLAALPRSEGALSNCGVGLAQS